MATATQSYGEAGNEPATRSVTRELPNLGNAAVAKEYQRQREIIRMAALERRDEALFWESAQTDEGWV